MPLQGAELDQTHEGGILGVFGNQVRGDGAEDLPVILGLDGFLGEEHLLGPVGPFLDDGPVEGFLAGEVFEHQGFTDPQVLGDFPGGCPAESLLRKELHGPTQNLLTTIPAGHSGSHAVPLSRVV